MNQTQTRLEERKHFYPVGDHARLVRDDLGVEIATYERNGKFLAMGFRGTSAKPAFHFNFRTAEARQAYVDTFLANRAAQNQSKAERKAQRKAFKHTLKVGDILHCSWGYEQTNCDYYQVVEVRGAIVVIREIGSRSVGGGGHMSEYLMPVPDSFKGEPMRKRVAEGNNITIESYAHANPWDGRKNYSSWYA